MMGGTIPAVLWIRSTMTVFAHLYKTLLVGALALASCDVSDEGLFCQRDFECEFQCSRVQECLGTDGGRDIRVHWTINGVAPSPADPSGCGSIVNFEVHMESDNRRDDAVSYFPVPCQLGQVFYDLMPDRLTNLRLIGKDANGTAIVIEERRIESTSTTHNIDFSL